MDETTSSESTHDLLLALAGRVDDDMLALGRELVAVGEDARAIELLTATLVAERAVLPAPLRTALVTAAREARTDLDAAVALAPSGPEEGTEHRFDPEPAAGPVGVTSRRPSASCRCGCCRDAGCGSPGA